MQEASEKLLQAQQQLEDAEKQNKRLLVSERLALEDANDSKTRLKQAEFQIKQLQVQEILEV